MAGRKAIDLCPPFITTPFQNSLPFLAWREREIFPQEENKIPHVFFNIPVLGQEPR